MIRRPPRSTQSRSSAASDVYKRQVELDDGARRAPVERLDVATPTSAWEYGVRDLYENVLKPSGFHIEAIARVPYICEGDHLAGAYVLDDCVFVLRRV